MLVLIRMLAEDSKKRDDDHMLAHRKGHLIWEHIIHEKKQMETALQGQAQMLYLTLLARSVKRGDVSLFLHVTGKSVLGDFIVNRLSQIPGVTHINCVGLHEPIFFPFPKDASNWIRLSVLLDVQPVMVRDVYRMVAGQQCPVGMRKSYVCYNFSDFKGGVQFSLFTQSRDLSVRHLDNDISTLPGVRGYQLMPIEASHPLISHEEWKRYSKKHKLITTWDQERMLEQFEK